MTYETALELIAKYGNGLPWTDHCVAVSKLAVHLGEHLPDTANIDVDFLRSASLVHDIGRYRDHHPIIHGVEGFRLLSGLGYAREAFICASHTLHGLKRTDAVKYGLPDMDFIPGTLEEKLIAISDSLMDHTSPTTLDKRFKSLRARYKSNHDFMNRLDEAEHTARLTIDMFNEKFGLSIEQIAINAFHDRT
ncbi:MAG: HDIG domain-containing protein [Nitrospirota bacterium]|nr:MAG: HDIG domain-containing protein [Nitrospirota bacterium]